MVEIGILTPEDRGELLEGWIVQKMTQHPLHATVLEYAQDVLRLLLPQGWRLREQKPMTTPEDSLPEPDLAIVRGPASRYERRHPGPADVALVVEVADTFLQEDRERKGRIYARARIPVYWIINLPDEQVEVYTRPRAGKTAAYRDRHDYARGKVFPLVIEGRQIAEVAVDALLLQNPPEENS
jgi:Uma2 family endonuclease